MSGKKTILVGCDLHKSFKFEDFKVKNISGLSTYLSGQESELQSIIQKTKYDNLDILVPGPIPPNPAELIISDHFDEMMKELKRKYDVIIMDSSPLGLTNETLYLTRMADFTLFILRQNYSKKAFADDINSLKEKKGVENLYVVLNDIPRKYLSHGGYGYGYYQEDRRQQPVLQRIFGGARKQA